MGFFDLLSKAANVVVPAALDWLENQNTTEESDTTNFEELIGECDEYLKIIAKLTVDDVDEILDYLSGIDRRILKLDKMDQTTDDYSLSKNLSRLQDEREKAISAIEEKFYKLLDEINKESEAEKDPDTWRKISDRWYKYNHELERITNYQIKYLEKLANQASAF